MDLEKQIGLTVKVKAILYLRTALNHGINNAGNEGEEACYGIMLSALDEILKDNGITPEEILKYELDEKEI